MSNFSSISFQHSIFLYEIFGKCLAQTIESFNFFVKKGHDENVVYCEISLSIADIAVITTIARLSGYRMIATIAEIDQVSPKARDDRL